MVSIQEIFLEKLYIKKTAMLNHLFPYKKCVNEKRTYVNKLKFSSLLTVFLSIPLNRLPCINHRKLRGSFVLTVIILTVPADPNCPDILNASTKVTSLFYVLFQTPHFFSWETFNDYVDTVLPFFDHIPISTWTFLTLNVDNNRTFWTAYPPLIVHVVIDRPNYIQKGLRLHQ
jgi:hypothetical protein